MQKTLLTLLLKNLAITIPTALLFTGLGYLLSFPMTFQVDPMAAQFRRNQGRQFEAATPPVAIETDRINALGQFQIMVSLGGTIAGVLVAQTVFMVHEQHSTRE